MTWIKRWLFPYTTKKFSMEDWENSKDIEVIDEEVIPNHVHRVIRDGRCTECNKPPK